MKALSTYQTIVTEICARGTNRQRSSSSAARLRCSLKVAYLSPDLESARRFPAVLLGAEAMATRAEMLADWAKSGEEALGVTRRLDAAPRRFPLHACSCSQPFVADSPSNRLPVYDRLIVDQFWA